MTCTDGVICKNIKKIIKDENFKFDSKLIFILNYERNYQLTFLLSVLKFLIRIKTWILSLFERIVFSAGKIFVEIKINFQFLLMAKDSTKST